MTLWNGSDEVLCHVKWQSFMIESGKYVFIITFSLKYKFWYTWRSMISIHVGVDKQISKTLARDGRKKPGIYINEKPPNPLEN